MEVMKIMLTYDDIKKINFDKIDTEEEFKEALKLTDEEFTELMRSGYDSTDTDTPETLRDYRIDIITKDDRCVSFDFTYTLDDDGLNSIKAYID